MEESRKVTITRAEELVVMFVCRVVREGRVERSSENSLDGRPVIASGGGQAVRRRAIRTRDTRILLS